MNATPTPESPAPSNASMNPGLILDVIRFELARSLTLGRAMIWIALVAFPVTLISILNATLQTANRGLPLDEEPIGFVLYFLVPEVVCLLGLLLWATPAIATEVEGQTWIYLAMRTSGRSIVALGKYLTAIVWTFSAAVTAITICVWVIDPMQPTHWWKVMTALALLSCVAHGALFLLIGLIFHRRTMVTAVGYTMICEYGISLIPALANKLTVNYRLRGLLAEWMQWDEVRNRLETVFGSEPASTHLLALLIYTVLLLTVSLIRLRQAEFPTQQDG